MSEEFIHDIEHREMEMTYSVAAKPALKMGSQFKSNIEELDPLDRNLEKPEGGKKNKRKIKFGRNKIRYYSRSPNLGEDGDEPTMVIKFDEDDTIINENADAESLKALLEVLDARLFSRWVQDPKREIDELDECVQISRTIRPFLENTHALSIYAHDTFWQDLLNKFPVLIDWLLDMLCSASKKEDEFEESRDAVFKILDSIRVFVKKSKSKQSGNLADGIIETARAPVFYYLLTEALQEDLDMMNIFLMQMNIDHHHHHLSNLRGLKYGALREVANHNSGLLSLFQGAITRQAEETKVGSSVESNTMTLVKSLSEKAKAAAEEERLKEIRSAHKSIRNRSRRGSDLKQRRSQSVEGLVGIGNGHMVYSKEHGVAVGKIQNMVRRMRSRTRIQRITKLLIATNRGDYEEAAHLRLALMKSNQYDAYLMQDDSAVKIQRVWRGVCSRRTLDHMKQAEVKTMGELMKTKTGLKVPSAQLSAVATKIHRQNSTFFEQDVPEDMVVGDEDAQTMGDLKKAKKESKKESKKELKGNLKKPSAQLSAMAAKIHQQNSAAQDVPEDVEAVDEEPERLSHAQRGAKVGKNIGKAIAGENGAVILGTTSLIIGHGVDFGHNAFKSLKNVGRRKQDKNTTQLSPRQKPNQSKDTPAIVVNDEREQNRAAAEPEKKHDQATELVFNPKQVPPVTKPDKKNVSARKWASFENLTAVTDAQTGLGSNI